MSEKVLHLKNEKLLFTGPSQLQVTHLTVQLLLVHDESGMVVAKPSYCVGILAILSRYFFSHYPMYAPPFSKRSDASMGAYYKIHHTYLKYAQESCITNNIQKCSVHSHTLNHKKKYVVLQ